MGPEPSRVLRTTSCATLRARHFDLGSTWVVELSGEADLATVDMLRDELEWMRARGPARVVVNLAALDFCDVQSATMILTAERTAPVVLRGARGTVRRVFDVLDTIQRLPGQPPLAARAAGVP